MVVEHLTQIVFSALTKNRSRHLAMFELLLESVRRPGLRAALTETLAAQNELILQLHRAAGIELTEREAAVLVHAITGFVFTELTAPAAGPTGLRDRIRATIAAVHHVRSAA
jgi:hypothetical protein